MKNFRKAAMKNYLSGALNYIAGQDVVVPESDDNVKRILDSLKNSSLPKDRRTAMARLTTVIQKSVDLQKEAGNLGMPVYIAILQQDRAFDENILQVLELILALTTIHTTQSATDTREHDEDQYQHPHNNNHFHHSSTTNTHNQHACNVARDNMSAFIFGSLQHAQIRAADKRPFSFDKNLNEGVLGDANDGTRALFTNRSGNTSNSANDHSDQENDAHKHPGGMDSLIDYLDHDCHKVRLLVIEVLKNFVINLDKAVVQEAMVCSDLQDPPISSSSVSKLVSALYIQEPKPIVRNGMLLVLTHLCEAKTAIARALVLESALQAIFAIINNIITKYVDNSTSIPVYTGLQNKRKKKNTHSSDEDNHNHNHHNEEEEDDDDDDEEFTKMEDYMVLVDCLQLTFNLLQGYLASRTLFREYNCLDSLPSVLVLATHDNAIFTSNNANTSLTKILLLILKILQAVNMDSNQETRQNRKACSDLLVQVAAILLALPQDVNHLNTNQVNILIETLTALRYIIIENKENRQRLASFVLESISAAHPHTFDAIYDLLWNWVTVSIWASIRCAAFQLIIELLRNESARPSDILLQAVLGSRSKTSSNARTVSQITSCTTNAKRALFGWPSTADASSVFYAATLYSWMITNSSQSDDVRKRLLSVPTDSKSQTKDALLNNCVRSLNLMERESGPVVARVALLKLLCSWLCTSPEALSAFFASPVNLSFIVELACKKDSFGTASEPHTRGLACLILSMSLQLDQSQTDTIPTNAITDIIKDRIGVSNFTSHLDQVRSSHVYAVALGGRSVVSNMSDNYPYLSIAQETASQELAIEMPLSANGDLGHEYWYEKEFTFLYDAVFNKLQEHILDIVSKPVSTQTSSQPPQQFQSRNVFPSETHEKSPDDDSTIVVLTSYKEVIREQDLKIENMNKEMERLKAVLEETQKELDQRVFSGAQASNANEEKLAQLLEEKQALEARTEELEKFLEEKSQDMESMARAYNDLEQELAEANSKSFETAQDEEDKKVSAVFVNELKASLEETTQTLEQERAKVHKLETSIKFLKETEKELQIKNSSLQEQNTKLEKLLDGEDDDIKELTDAVMIGAELKESRLILKQKDAHVAEIEKELDIIQNALIESRAKTKFCTVENEQLRRSLRRTEEELEQLKIQKSQELKSLKNDFQTRIKTLEDENDNFKSSLDEMMTSNSKVELDVMKEKVEKLELELNEKSEAFNNLVSENESNVIIKEKLSKEVEDLYAKLKDEKAQFEEATRELKEEREENNRLTLLARELQADIEGKNRNSVASTQIVDSLKKESKSLQQALNEKKTAIKENEQIIEKLQIELSERQNHTMRLSERIQDYEKKLAELEDQRHKANEETKKILKEKEDLIEDFKRVLAEKEGFEAVKEALINECNNLRAELNQLSSKDDKDNEISALEKQLLDASVTISEQEEALLLAKTKEKELEDLINEYVDANNEFNNVLKAKEESLAQLQEQYDEKCRESASLEMKFDELQSTKKTGDEDMRNIEMALNAVTEKLRNSDQEKNELQRAVETLTDAVQKLEAEKSEILSKGSDLKKELEDLKIEKEQLLANQSLHNDIESELREMQVILEEKDKMLETYSIGLENIVYHLNQHAKSVFSELSNEKKSVERNSTEPTDINTWCTEIIEALQKRKKDLERDLEDKSKSHDDLISELTAVKEQLISIQISSQVDVQLKKELEERLNSQEENIKQSKTELTELNKKLQDAMTENDKAEQEFVDLKEEKKQLEQQLFEGQALIEEKTLEVQELMSKLETSNAELIELKEKVQDLTTEKEKAKQEVMDLNERHEQVEKQLSESQALLEKKTLETQELMSVLETIKNDFHNDLLEKDKIIEKLRDNLELATSEKDDNQQTTVKALEQAITDKDKTISKLKEVINEKTQALDEQLSLNEKISTLEDEVKGLTVKCDAHEQQKSDLEELVARKLSEIKELEVQLEVALIENKTTQETLEQLQRELDSKSRSLVEKEAEPKEDLSSFWERITSLESEVKDQDLKLKSSKEETKRVSTELQLLRTEHESLVAEKMQVETELSELDDLKFHKDLLLDELESLQKENESLRFNFDKLEQEKVVLESKGSNCAEEGNVLSAELEKLREENAVLVKTQEDLLKAQYGLKQDSNKQLEDIRSLTDEIEYLTKKYENATKELAGLQKNDTNVMGGDKKLRQLSDEALSEKASMAVLLASLQDKYECLSGQQEFGTPEKTDVIDSDLDSKLDDLRFERDLLADELDNLKQEHENLKDEYKTSRIKEDSSHVDVELEPGLDDLRFERDLLTDELDNLKKEHENLKNEYESLIKTKANSSHAETNIDPALNDLRFERDLLADELDNIKREHENLKKEYETISKTNERSNLEEDSLQPSGYEIFNDNAANEINKAAEETRSVKIENEALKRVHEHVLEQLNGAMTELANLRSREDVMLDEIQELKDQIARFQQENVILSENAERIRVEKERLSVEANIVKANYIDLERSRDELAKQNEEEIDNLQLALDDMRFEKDLLSSELKNLENELQSSRVDSSANENSVKQLHDMHSERDTLLDELSSMRKRHDEIFSQKENLSREFEKLSILNDSLCVEMESIRNALQQQQQERQLDTGREIEQNDLLRTALLDKQFRLNDAERRHRELMNEFQQLHQSYEDARKKQRILEEKLEKAESEPHAPNVAIIDLENDLRQKQDIIEDLTQKLRNALSSHHTGNKINTSGDDLKFDSFQESCDIACPFCKKLFHLRESQTGQRLLDERNKWAFDRADLKEVCEGLKVSIGLKETEIRALRENFDRQRKDLQQARLQVKKLKETVDELLPSSSAAAQAKSDLSKLQAEFLKLQSEMYKAVQENEYLRADTIAGLGAKIRELSMMKSQQEQEHEVLERKVHELELEVQKLEIEKDDARRVASEFETFLDSTKIQLGSSQRKVQSLEEQLNKQNQEFSKLQNRNEELSNELQKKTDAESKLSDQVRDLSSRHEIAQEQSLVVISEVKSKSDMLQSRLDDMLLQKKLLEEKFDDSLLEIASLRAREEKHNSDVQKMEDMFSSMEEKSREERANLLRHIEKVEERLRVKEENENGQVSSTSALQSRIMELEERYHALSLERTEIMDTLEKVVLETDHSFEKINQGYAGLSKKLAFATHQNELLRAENSSLGEERSKWQNLERELRKMLSEQESKLEKALLELRSSEQACSLLEGRASQYALKVDEYQKKNKVSTAQSRNMARTIQELEQENFGLKNRLTDLEEESAISKQTLESLQMKRDELERFSKAKTEEISALEEKLMTLEAGLIRMNELNSKVQHQEKLQGELRQSKKELETMIVSLKQENRQAKDEVELMQRDKVLKDSQLEKLRKELEMTMTRLKELNALFLEAIATKDECELKLGRLEEENQKLRNENEVSVGLQETLNSQLADARAANDEMVLQIREVEAEKQTLNADIEMLHAEKETLHTEKANAISDKIAREKKLEKVQSEFELFRESALMKIEELQGEIQETTIERDELKKRLFDYKDTLERYKSEQQSLNEEIFRLNGELQDVVNALESELEEKRVALGSNQELQSRMVILEKQLRDAKEGIQVMKSKLETADQEKGFVLENNQKLQSKVVMLEKQVKDANEGIQVMKSKLEATSLQYSNLQSELKELEGVREEARGLETQVENLESMLEDLNNTTEERTSELESMVAKKNEQLNDLMTQKKTLEARLLSAEIEATEALAEKEMLTKEVKDLKRLFSEVKMLSLRQAKEIEKLRSR